MNEEGCKNGRTHEPSLRELAVELDGLRDLLDERDKRYDQRFQAQETALSASRDKSQFFLAVSISILALIVAVGVAIMRAAK